MDEAEDKFVRDLQEQILEETKEAYGEKAYNRWLNPICMGSIRDPDGCACLRGLCGDTMEIFLRFENDRIKEASFKADGCGASVVCGSFAAEMAVGKNPDEILEITGEAILKKLGKLPEKDEHCALLASETLQEALNDYMMKQTQTAEQ